MTVALRSPELVGALILVDNAPVDAHLKSEFHKYVQGLREVEEAQVKRQVEADDILKKYEEVSKTFSPLLQHTSYLVRPLPFGNFSLPILCGLQTDNIYGFVSLSRPLL